MSDFNNSQAAQEMHCIPDREQFADLLYQIQYGSHIPLDVVRKNILPVRKWIKDIGYIVSDQFVSTAWMPF